MHLAEGGPGTNQSGGDERLSQFSNSVLSSQREQVPTHVPSSQAANVQPPAQSHISVASSISSSGNPSSTGLSKTLGHDQGVANVRYKVSLR